MTEKIRIRYRVEDPTTGVEFEDVLILEIASMEHRVRLLNADESMLAPMIAGYLAAVAPGFQFLEANE